MRQVLVVKTESIQLVEGVKLTEEAMEIFNLFKCYAFIAEHTDGDDLSHCLCLEPLTDEENDKFFEDSRYIYCSDNPYANEFVAILNELSDFARPLLFTEDDILATMDL